MLPAHIAVCIYIMTGKADVSTASRAAASGEESVETRAPARNPVLSPSSDSADTTEAAVEEPSVPASPSPADTAPAVSAAVSAESDAGSVSGSPPPEAWGAIMSFLDRPQEARQSALASLPTSDLIRLTLEASATALGRLGWYEGTSVSAAAQIKDEDPDAAPVPPPDTSSAPAVAVQGLSHPPPWGQLDLPSPVAVRSRVALDPPTILHPTLPPTRPLPKARQPDAPTPAARPAPEIVPDDSDELAAAEGAAQRKPKCKLIPTSQVAIALQIVLEHIFHFHQALGALLQALGQEYDEVTQPDIHKTECTVGGKWKVELLYMYADCPTEKTVEKPVEVVVEKEVPFIVEVERSRGVEASTGSQTTALWCAYCGAPGHSIAECPLLRLQQQVRQLELESKKPKHQDCQLCGDADHLAPNCPTLRRPTCFDACVQTDLQCQLCDKLGHIAKQCPLLAALMQKSDGATARIRVGGGWLIAPQVPGLGEPGLNEEEAIQALAAANTAGCMTKDGQVVYSKSRSPSRPRSAPGETRSVSPRSSKAQTPSSSPQRSPRDSPRTSTSAPKDQARILAAGPMGPERFKAMEQERAALSERIRDGQGKPPEQRSGFLYGTFVQGGHDKHRFSSDRGARSMYRVYRSSVSQDSAMDPSELRSASRRSSAAPQDEESDSDEYEADGCKCCHEQPQIVVIPAGSATAAIRGQRSKESSGKEASRSPSPASAR
ncbi:unnamed protein product [Symbiodinium microadriaticum]|nr:unnamed protein product [Symbiodinium microadriaticum]